MPRKYFFPKDPVIPSRVRDRMYIYYPPISDTDSENEDSSSCEADESQSSDNSQSSNELTTTRVECPKEDQIFSGKWMQFHDKSWINISRGMTRLDYIWQFTFPLVDDCKNTGITSALCSTDYRGAYPADPRSTDGVICMYTKDYRNKREVKKAGDAIRKFMSYPKDMFYKTDVATIEGKYRWFGHKHVSMYKHTPDNIMYERDQINPYLWHQIEF